MKMQKDKNRNFIRKTKMYKVGCIKDKKIPDHKIPSIKIFGTWLSEAGFEPNDLAQVTIYPRTLIVRQVINVEE